MFGGCINVGEIRLGKGSLTLDDIVVEGRVQSLVASYE
jgi:hypothetical protein